MAAAPHVIDLTTPRLLKKFPERGDEVMTVDVVANLFALVTEHTVCLTRDSAFHQVSEEAV